MFAIAIWDNKKNELFLVRDRLGKKPLLYYYDNKKFIFASEMQALLENKIIPKSINHKAIDYYLSLQYIPAPHTIFKDVHKLEAASYAIINKRGIKKVKYWDLDYRSKIIASDHELSELILNKLKESIKLRLISDVPLGAFLSGGIDSSAIVALMSELSDSPVNTFSIGFTNDKYNELPYAKEVADKFGTKHHEFVVTPDAMKVLPDLVKHYGEPYADSSALPSYYVAKETRKFVTVALNGDGGDENFGGYPWYKANKIAAWYDILPGFIRQGVINKVLLKIFSSNTTFNRRLGIFINSHSLEPSKRYPYYITSSFFTNWEKNNLYSDEFKANVGSVDAYERISEFYLKAKANNPIERASYADIHSYLTDDLLVKVDIASTMNSLESRSPFLDHEFMELIARIDSSKKVNFLTSKHILKKVLSGKVPDSVLHKKKMGFMVPLNEWFRGDLRKYAAEVLLDNKSLQRDYFSKTYITKILDEHNKGKIDNGSRIWSLLFLELWYREFIDK